jgi:cellulose synthase/poly-beta-1,6-N-acetylglucosamine synthase-like glycosyltransferase
MHGKVQTGCSLNIIDRFKDAGEEISTYQDEESTFYKVDRLCMWRRSEQTEDIQKDVYIRSNIVVMHDDGHDLDQTLEDIYNLDTPKPPRVIVCHTTKNLLEIYNKWSKRFGSDRFSCVQLIESLYDGSGCDSAFKRSKNGWVFFIKSGDRVDKDMLNALNHSINYKMGKHLATTGIICYMAVAYKYLKGHLGNIHEAIMDIEGATKEWKEIDEDYRLHISRQSS